jgi:hypothetical protein
MLDVIVIVSFLALSCGFGWWMRNSAVRTLQGKLKNVELLCDRLLHRLQEQDAQLRQRDGQIRQLDERLRQYTDRQRRLMSPPRKPT